MARFFGHLDVFFSLYVVLSWECRDDVGISSSRAHRDSYEELGLLLIEAPMDLEEHMTPLKWLLGSDTIPGVCRNPAGSSRLSLWKQPEVVCEPRTPCTLTRIPAIVNRVCMYVCMSVCMYACMHACMHVYIYMCMYMQAYVCIYIYKYVDIDIDIDIDMDMQIQI